MHGLFNSLWIIQLRNKVGKLATTAGIAALCPQIITTIIDNQECSDCRALKKKTDSCL